MHIAFSMQEGLWCILVMTIVTFSIRAIAFCVKLPTAVKSSLERGQDLFPALFLTLLVLYCVSEPFNLVVNYRSFLSYYPTLISSVCVFIIHWWKSKIYLSLGFGMLLHLLLSNLF